jgi:CRP/FNR family cyclic AMP-dependent transcriptional regulator
MENGPIDWTGMRVHRAKYERGARIFAQGESCASVLYIEHGSVRLSVVSHGGKEAIVGIIERDHFFGEGCLAGQPRRTSSATAHTPIAVVEVGRDVFLRRLLARPDIAQRFLRHMLTRNARIEEDLIDQLFNDAEKRLARKLLLMARFGGEQALHRECPVVSQTVLAEMVGTTRSRVNAFMNKFRRLGFIEYSGGAIKVHHSLLTVLLRDDGSSPSGSRSARALPLPNQAGRDARRWINESQLTLIGSSSQERPA